MRISQSISCFPVLVLFLGPLAGGDAEAAETDAEAIEFFESKIRPVLARQCYECHSTAGKQRGGLNLDHRDSLRKGGDSGPVIVPGKPGESLLLKAIRHEEPDLKMPKAGPRIGDAVVEDFSKWIAMGAPDPRDQPPSKDELEAITSWEAVMEERKQWWSFRPIASPPVPSLQGAPSRHPVDQFLFQKQREAGLAPAERAGKNALIRRAYFVITGLPPTPEQVEAFGEDNSGEAFEKLVDELLESEAFGERWARHWMDWVRYAESHGSEGDPAIPHAWRYRDYLIRALNEDVPYDQLVREHIAGDLLENPRVADGINQSAIGTAHYRMVHHGFAPTDALDEQVRFTENQIDVVTKTFLGLTVSCARCHDHKFDAISQADFYSLYGIITSSRPALINVDVRAGSEDAREVMQRLKEMVRARLARNWTSRKIADSLLVPEGPWESAIESAKDMGNPLHAWQKLAKLEGAAFAEEWERLAQAWKESAEKLEKQRLYPYFKRWNVGTPDAAEWFTHGTGMPKPEPASPGEFHLFHDGERVVSGIFPAGLLSHRLTTRDNAVFESPKVNVSEGLRLFARIAGDDQILARYVVQDYPRDGTVYPVARIKGGNWRWQSWSLNYWEGDRVHFEAATAADSPVLARQGSDRSWVALQEVVLARKDDPAPVSHFAEVVTPLFGAASERPPKSPGQLAALYEEVLESCIAGWNDDTLDDSQARFLDFFARSNLLPNTLDDLPTVAPLVQEFRELEAKLKAPVRSPGVVQAELITQPLFNRGNHRDPAEPVPRRYLDAFGARPYPEGTSGRLELAEDMLSEKTPLTARVIVNRLWHHVFGQGIVATTDNFGKLGSSPSHPGLLDYLATRMKLDGWSIKKMVRLFVTSEAFKASSRPSPRSLTADPTNALLSHYPVRRLEAESIRDNVLAVSGQLNREKFGSPVDGKSDRRSVYVRVIRNRLDPFLTAFNAPVPNSTHGARAISNVPAQSLIMMNSEFIRSAAVRWAEDVSAQEGTQRDQIRGMFFKALGRPPTLEEVSAASAFVDDSRDRAAAAIARRKTLERDLHQAREELTSLIEPLRERLAEEKKAAVEKTGDVKASIRESLTPRAAWDFSTGAEDQIGGLDLELKGGAKVEDGALVLSGDGAYARSARLRSELKAKTLEAWVRLERLDQGGGGVLTVQSADGRVFDSIVYAEAEPRRWMAGSDGFRRTGSFQGAEEKKSAISEPVHLAIVYRADGSITGYRNGRPYGKSYRKSGLVSYPAGNSNLLFGLRHEDNNGFLAGRIYRARLYDRALSPEEVLASSANNLLLLVTEKELDAALTEDQRTRRGKLEEVIRSSEEALKALERDGFSDPLRPLKSLAHSIFNLKEFVYLR